MDNRVSIFAYRILSRMETFSARTEEWFSDDILPEDSILGVYLNTVSKNKILIGSKALYYGDDDWVTVKYVDIDGIAIEDSKTKHTADTLLFFLIDGTIQRMCVDGGDTKFRDAYEFLRFVRRVINRA
ncbi:MAG TPA: hypothetical protein VD886_22780 [Herpetosiphonaceae bacterium]|nr:hypothetical protein [Herpetosiphonaceae bacterium]